MVALKAPDMGDTIAWCSGVITRLWRSAAAYHLVTSAIRCNRSHARKELYDPEHAPSVWMNRETSRIASSRTGGQRRAPNDAEDPARGQDHPEHRADHRLIIASVLAS